MGTRTVYRGIHSGLDFRALPTSHTVLCHHDKYNADPVAESLRRTELVSDFQPLRAVRSGWRNKEHQNSTAYASHNIGFLRAHFHTVTRQLSASLAAMRPQYTSLRRTQLMHAKSDSYKKKNHDRCNWLHGKQYSDKTSRIFTSLLSSQLVWRHLLKLCASCPHYLRTCAHWYPVWHLLPHFLCQ